MNAGLWRRRRSRAIELLSRAPHADEMLEFYVGLVELQESVAEESAPLNAVASEALASGESVSGLPVRLEQLPADAIEPLFAGFLRSLEPIGTAVMARAARTLLDADAAERFKTLRAFWLNPDADDFLPRAFTEGVAWSLARHAAELTPHPDQRGEGAGSGGAPALQLSCPICGSPPQVGVLRDDPGALGRRLLVCSLCATEWAFPRLTCVHCGSSDSDRLQIHEAESVPHVRIEECAECAHYVKAVDLRKDGAAEPVVDELATPELDIWARDRGLVKVQLNLLGL